MLGGHNACVYPVQTEKQAGWKPVTSPPASASPCLLMTHCQMVILFLLNGDSLQFVAHHADLVMTGEIVCSIFALFSANWKNWREKHEMYGKNIVLNRFPPDYMVSSGFFVPPK